MSTSSQQTNTQPSAVEETAHLPGAGNGAPVTSSRARVVSLNGEPAAPLLPTTFAAPTCTELVVYRVDIAQPTVTRIAYDNDLTAYLRAIEDAVLAALRDFSLSIPREIVAVPVENFIHANFIDTTVSLYNDGTTLVFADHGPGIEDFDRAKKPGFTTAGPFQKRAIAGIGSGLFILRNALGALGGTFRMEDNLGQGTVLTITLPSTLRAHETPTRTHPLSEHPATETSAPGTAPTVDPEASGEATPSFPYLSERQFAVLTVCINLDEVGPSTVSHLLDIPLSTAHRDLTFLQKHGLVEVSATGKRIVTEKGIQLTLASTR